MKKPIEYIEINSRGKWSTVWFHRQGDHTEARHYSDPTPASMVRAFLAIMRLMELAQEAER